MTRYTVNCSILLDTVPLMERPAAAQAAGFTGVEFWWPFATAVPGDAEVDTFVRAITDAGVQLTGLNFFAGDMPAGDRGLVSNPARSAEFRDNIDVVVGIGDRHQSSLAQGVGEPSGAQDEDLAPGLELRGQQPRRRLRAGHYVLLVRMHSEIGQVSSDLDGWTGRVVGHEGQTHAGFASSGE